MDADLDGTLYTANAGSSDTLATIIQALAVQLPCTATRSRSTARPERHARGRAPGRDHREPRRHPADAGQHLRQLTFFNEGDLGFTGTPVAGETWTVFVDGHPISTVSSAGESLAQVISSLAAQIPGIPPFDYLFSAGLGDLYVQHGFWLFFGYSFISLGGTVTLNPGQIYGSISVVNSAPVGVNIALNAPSGGPAAGETWTLTLDGTKYAYAYNGTGGLNAIASALAGLIPQSAATAHGGPYYSVGVSGSSIVVRRSDQTVAVTASVSVSLPATAQTVPNPLNAKQTTVTYTGTPLEGEVWAITVDGTTYSYISTPATA